MLEEAAMVVEANIDYLWVETRSRTGCSQCGSSCTTSVVSKLFGMKRNRLKLENTLCAEVGDRVVVGIPDELLVRASVWAYLIPLLAMFAVSVTGGVMGVCEGAQALLAMAGLVAGFAMVRWHTLRQGARQRFRPSLLRIVSDDVMFSPVRQMTAL
ncbi:MAG: SoxR reducing system RseC family protein [Candidatus Thiodiazotropha endolucinida]|nr:SoxR reducing system RseC family protein [Candidatus Thiodiazotropha taylori]MCG8096587.1 SoxR reducing system RseC family protein [Candidatus Thiodiazotropha endolucinida]MCG8058444.1 SoxR reducing system RseC family protein [Candidatus Thiodiazotropha taylori]MCG8064731.1 SoxR reducing system RseC family protein [Candidatus Thiodiazotropha taylori]MCG8071162.1 SoxR reducing system RseC family protein [Candidatus Thiodiazotropha taylori]